MHYSESSGSVMALYENIFTGKIDLTFPDFSAVELIAGETTSNIFAVLPFAQTAKEKKKNCFHEFQKVEKKIDN